MTVSFLPSAEKQFLKLDKTAQRRIQKYILELQDLHDPRVRGKALVGEAVAVEEADNSRSGKIDLLLKHSVGRKHLHQYLCGVVGFGVADGDSSGSFF